MRGARHASRFSSVSFEIWQVAWFTTWVAAVGTLLILAPGVALAWLLARKDWRGKTLVETIVALPLVMPPVATGLILLILFGRRGLLGRWFEDVFGSATPSRAIWSARGWVSATA